MKCEEEQQYTVSESQNYDFGGIEEGEGTTIVSAKEDCLCLHLDVGRVTVKAFAHAVVHHSFKLLDFFLSHLHSLCFLTHC